MRTERGTLYYLEKHMDLSRFVRLRDHHMTSVELGISANRRVVRLQQDGILRKIERADEGKRSKWLYGPGPMYEAVISKWEERSK